MPSVEKEAPVIDVVSKKVAALKSDPQRFGSVVSRVTASVCRLGFVNR